MQAGRIEWRRAHDTAENFHGIANRMFVAQVVRYGDHDTHQPFWQGFLRGEPATGRCVSPQEAMAAVETALAGS